MTRLFISAKTLTYFLEISNIISEHCVRLLKISQKSLGRVKPAKMYFFPIVLNIVSNAITKDKVTTYSIIVLNKIPK